MPRVSSAYLARRRRQILDAATTCFARDGFHRATMQDVVHQAALIAQRERVAVVPFTYLPQLQKYFAQQHETYLTKAAQLPGTVVMCSRG